MRYTALAIDHPEACFVADLDHQTGVLYARDRIEALDLLWCVAFRDLYETSPLNGLLLNIMSVIVVPGDPIVPMPGDDMDRAFTRQGPYWGGETSLKRRYENGLAKEPLEGFEHNPEPAKHSNVHMDGVHAILTRSYKRAPSTALLCAVTPQEREYALEIEDMDKLHMSYDRPRKDVSNLFCERAFKASRVPIVQGIPGCITGIRGAAMEGETAHYRWPYFAPRYVSIRRSKNLPPRYAMMDIQVTAATPMAHSTLKQQAVAREFMPKNRLGA